MLASDAAHLAEPLQPNGQATRQQTRAAGFDPGRGRGMGAAIALCSRPLVVLACMQDGRLLMAVKSVSCSFLFQKVRWPNG